MKNIFLSSLLILYFAFAQDIKVGAKNYLTYLPLLKGKNVGIVTNQKGIINSNIHIVDFLI